MKLMENKKSLEVLKEMAQYEKENGFPNLELIRVSASAEAVTVVRIYGTPEDENELDAEVEVINLYNENDFYHLHKIVDGQDAEFYGELMAKFDSEEILPVFSRETFKEIVDIIDYKEKFENEFKYYMEVENDEPMEDEDLLGLYPIAWDERVFDNEYTEDDYNEDEDFQKMGTLKEVNEMSFDVNSQLKISEFGVAWVESVDNIIEKVVPVSYQDAYETFKALNNCSLDWVELLEYGFYQAYEIVEKHREALEKLDWNIFAYNQKRFGITL